MFELGPLSALTDVISLNGRKSYIEFDCKYWRIPQSLMILKMGGLRMS